MRKLELHYATYYEPEAGNGIQQKFYSKEANETFAEALPLMGVSVIIKSQWDPEQRKWVPYQ